MTLLEQCISILLMSIISMLCVTSWHSIQSFQQTIYITQLLNQSILFAREQSILRYQNVMIVPINHHWKNGWMIQTEYPKKVLYSTPAMPLDVTFINFQRKTNLVKIFPNGTAMGYQGHFEYGSSKLFINQGGRTRIENK